MTEMNDIQVLFVLLMPLPHPGAAWTRIEFFAEYLKNLGYNVTIAGAFSVRTLDMAGSVKWNGISIHNMIPAIEMNNFFSHLFNILSSLIVSIFLFIRVRPRLVVISVPSSGNVIGCYIAAKLFRCKIITDYRDQWEDLVYQLSKSKLSRVFLKTMKSITTKYYCKSDAVIAVTEPFANSLKARGVKKVKVIPNGADLTVFRRRDKTLCRQKIGISRDDFVLIFSGYIGGYYRVDILLRSLKQAINYNNQNIKLLIVGRGDGLQSVLELVDILGLKGNVLYLGKIIEKEKLVDTLGAADIGIIPYDSNPLWRDTLPVKSLEYFACGLPVIATAYDDSLIGRIIIDNRVGLVTKSEDIGCLCDAIMRLKTDLYMRNSSGERALSLVSRSYDRHKLGLEFYRMVSDHLDDQR
jgi:glycosyltransferase involved in cell wall biosynthesis